MLKMISSIVVSIENPGNKLGYKSEVRRSDCRCIVNELYYTIDKDILQIKREKDYTKKKLVVGGLQSA